MCRDDGGWARGRKDLLPSLEEAMIDRRMTVGRYLVRPLEQLSLKHVSGAPGDYTLRFLDLIEKTTWIPSTRGASRTRAVSGIDMFLIK